MTYMPKKKKVAAKFEKLSRCNNCLKWVNVLSYGMLLMMPTTTTITFFDIFAFFF